MPTAKYFDRCPEFPSDVPLAEVATISLKSLESGSDEESWKLFQACRKQGFFFLQLEDTSRGQQLLRDAEAMFDLTNEVFDLDRDTLDQFAFKPPKSLLGYKATGNTKTEEGKPDITEMFNIGRDDILDQAASPQSLPQVIQDRKQQCQSFCLHAHEALGTILDSLDRQLDLPTETLRSLSPLHKPSSSTIRLIRARSTALGDNQLVTLGGHTDIATIGMLFNVVGGLQILPGDSEHAYQNWQFVRPQPGCAFINLGDTMVELTGEVLRSSLHRVHNPPGDQASTVRQSLAYFVRPSSDRTMARFGGSSVIPVLPADRVDAAISVDEWATRRNQDLFEGRLLPKTRGGIPLAMEQKPRVTASVASS